VPAEMPNAEVPQGSRDPSGRRRKGASPLAFRCLATCAYQPYVVIPVLNTLASLVYLWGYPETRGAEALSSLLLSFFAGVGLYYLIFHIVPRRKVVAIPLAVLLAALITTLHLVHFGYYQVFGNMLPIGAVNYFLRLPAHGFVLGWEEVTIWHVAAWVLVVALLSWYFALAMGKLGGGLRLRHAVLALFPAAMLTIAGFRPYLELEHYFLSTCVASLREVGTARGGFVPDRVDLPTLHLEAPPNVVVFLLESVARDCVEFYNPDLPTCPFWTGFIAEHPDEVFVARNHFSNSSASDVAIPILYCGAAPDDPLEIHRTAPLLWDYAKSAGYNTSAAMACAFVWGQFNIRFQHHAGHMNLDHVSHAFNSQKRLVHDLSMNDADVVAEALEYQQGRRWREPFLQTISLKMPHYLGQGARMNGFTFLNDRLPQDRLINYYNAIYHDDQLMGEYLAAMPSEVRENTVFLAVSDHGEDIYGRGARLESYHIEIARVPCWMYIPRRVQERLRAGAVENLRDNCQNLATSSIDLLPTLLDVMGLAEKEPVAEILGRLQGSSLLNAKEPPEFILMLNTNDLRHWEREGFGLTMDNGTWRYLYDMGRRSLYNLQDDPREERDLIDDPVAVPFLNRVQERVESDPYLLRIVKKCEGG